MPGTPPSGQLGPKDIQSLFAAVQAAGFDISIEDILRATAVTARFRPANNSERTQQLVNILTPLLARDRQGQKNLRVLFERWARNDLSPRRQLLASVDKPTHWQSIKRKQRRFIDLWRGAGLVVLACLAVFGAVKIPLPEVLAPQQPPEVSAPQQPPAVSAPQQSQVPDGDGDGLDYIIVSGQRQAVSGSGDNAVYAWLSFPFICAALWHFSQSRSAGRISPARRRRPGRIFQLDIPNGPLGTFMRFSARTGLQRLSQPLERSGLKLDVRPTIYATLRNSNYPTVVQTTQKIRPHYVLIIESIGRQDHVKWLFDTLVRDLDRLSIDASVYFARSNINHLVARGQGGRHFSLSDLGNLHRDARLLILGCGRTLRMSKDISGRRPPPFVSQRDGRPQYFAAFRQPTLLTTTPKDYWQLQAGGFERELIDNGVFLHPSTSDGLLAAAFIGEEALQPTVPNNAGWADGDFLDFLDRYRTRLLSEIPPPAEEVEWIAQELARFMSGLDQMRYPVSGLEILANLAWLPNLSPELTQYALTFAAQDGGREAAQATSDQELIADIQSQRMHEDRRDAVNDETAQYLSRLIWFQEGRMPHWLQMALKHRLPDPVMTAAEATAQRMWPGLLYQSSVTQHRDGADPVEVKIEAETLSSAFKSAAQFGQQLPFQRGEDDTLISAHAQPLRREGPGRVVNTAMAGLAIFFALLAVLVPFLLGPKVLGWFENLPDNWLPAWWPLLVAGGVLPQLVVINRVLMPVPIWRKTWRHRSDWNTGVKKIRAALRMVPVRKPLSDLTIDQRRALLGQIDEVKRYYQTHQNLSPAHKTPSQTMIAAAITLAWLALMPLPGWMTWTPSGGGLFSLDGFEFDGLMFLLLSAITIWPSWDQRHHLKKLANQGTPYKRSLASVGLGLFFFCFVIYAYLLLSEQIKTGNFGPELAGFCLFLHFSLFFIFIISNLYPAFLEFQISIRVVIEISVLSAASTLIMVFGFLVNNNFSVFSDTPIFLSFLIIVPLFYLFLWFKNFAAHETILELFTNIQLSNLQLTNTVFKYPPVFYFFLLFFVSIICSILVVIIGFALSGLISAVDVYDVLYFADSTLTAWDFITINALIAVSIMAGVQLSRFLLKFSPTWFRLLWSNPNRVLPHLPELAEEVQRSLVRDAANIETGSLDKTATSRPRAEPQRKAAFS